MPAAVPPSSPGFPEWVGMLRGHIRNIKCPALSVAALTFACPILLLLTTAPPAPPTAESCHLFTKTEWRHGKARLRGRWGTHHWDAAALEHGPQATADAPEALVGCEDRVLSPPVLPAPRATSPLAVALVLQVTEYSLLLLSRAVHKIIPDLEDRLAVRLLGLFTHLTSGHMRPPGTQEPVCKPLAHMCAA